MDARNIDTWSKDLIMYMRIMKQMEDLRKEAHLNDNEFYEAAYDEYLFFLSFVEANKMQDAFRRYKKEIQIQLLSIEEQLGLS